MPIRGVYLDYQASTPLDPQVKLSMSEAYDATGNASSEEHSFGWAASNRVERARGRIAEAVRALTEEVTFTSGATEANNIAILGAAMAAPSNRRRILISSIEHKSVSAAAFAAERFGFSIEVVPVTPDGCINPDELAPRLNGDVAIVSVMAVNNEIGTIQPVAELGRRVRAAGAFFHVDATQALAAIDVNLVEWSADALSLSGHKIYGPGGVGALVVGIDAPWRPLPLMYGGGQEQGLRPGTLPVPLCVGLGEACRLIASIGEAERTRVAELRDLLADRLRRSIPKLAVTTERSARHPGCLHVRFPMIGASGLLQSLQPRIAAATGSACTSGVIGPSHVLMALGMSQEHAGECVRFSVGRFSTRDEVEFAADCISSVVRRTDLTRSNATETDTVWA